MIQAWNGKTHDRDRLEVIGIIKVIEDRGVVHRDIHGAELATRSRVKELGRSETQPGGGTNTVSMVKRS